MFGRFVEHKEQKGKATKMVSFIFLGLAFFLCGCAEKFEPESKENLIATERCRVRNIMRSIVSQHEQKLRNYFLYGNGSGQDLSILIAETTAIALQMRARGMAQKADKFDSYLDVLMYGNRTIDESIRDVEDLVAGRSRAQVSSGYDNYSYSGSYSDNYDGSYGGRSGNRRRCCCNMRSNSAMGTGSVRGERYGESGERVGGGYRCRCERRNRAFYEREAASNEDLDSTGYYGEFAMRRGRGNRNGRSCRCKCC